MPAGVGDRRPGLGREQRQDLLVLPGERLPALLVGQIEVAHLHAPVSDRRPQEAPRQRRVSRKTQRAEVGRQVPEPERLRNRAQVLPQARPVGQVQEPLVFLGTHAGGDEILQVSQRVHGRDPAAAGAGQRAGALHHLAQDSIDVQALGDAQTGLAQPGEPVSQRLVLRSQLVGWLQLPTLVGVVAPLWLRANAPMVVAEVCSIMKYPKRSQYKHAKQKKYHVRNWAEYNEGLRRRGDLTVWFDEEAIANWMADKTGKPGGQRVYSDLAIETSLVVRMVYKLAYRQTEGFLNSIASLLGLGIEIPDYSTLCRRSRLLRKKLRIPKAASSQPIHLMIDSTGLRIHVGNARKPPKQRAWRKLHIAVDRKTGNIVASELTASRARDATRVPALLTQIQAPLVSVAADSAYDKEAVYETIEAHSPGRRTRVVIPPQRNTTLSQNSNTAMQERDRHIRAIERHGRREWYKLSGCTKRSMVENAVYRYKAIIGPEMRTRTLARQRVEHRIGCEILNKMTALGMPDTYCAG